MTNRQNISSGGKYESVQGYSRAVRAGNLVFVSGTTGVKEIEESSSDNDSYHQATRAIMNVESALKKADCPLESVVRTRVFLRRDADWREVARAHLEFFGRILPSSSMLVCEFLDPRILVEIEVDAVLDLN